ncbi:SMC family ATPase [Candidatus Bathyarchaeota archaeon]|nr:MAG: SMC family ATPase [Candidatus Bathyarchaeota archaeon]
MPGSFLPRRVRRRRPQPPDNGAIGVASENLARRGTGPDVPESPRQSQGGGASSRAGGVEGYGRKVARGGSQLKLVSLQAQNFKKLKLGKPLQFSDGIILITGLNESGKSTILDAILYALFGRVIRPSKMPSNDDIVGYGSGEAQIRLDFNIGETTYRVVREVHKTRPNRATLYEMGPSGRNRSLANSVKDVTSEIERLLGGITYDEIVASSVVAQKDLERLIKQRLDDRRKVINVFLNLESFNKVQDQLDTERTRIEGTSRNPGQLTVERQRLENLQEQLKEYEETGVQLVSLEGKVAKFKADQREKEKQLADTDSLHKMLNEYEESLTSIVTQQVELERAESEIKKYGDLAEAERAISRASEVLEKVREAELQRAQLDEREQKLQAQIVETNKRIADISESKRLIGPAPRRIWTYLTATAALGAGAILSFILTQLILTIVLGSLAAASLLLLARQIASLSEQAQASRKQQEQLANAQLIGSWTDELAAAKKDQDIANGKITQGSTEIRRVLNSIESYSSYLQGLDDPKEAVEQATSIYNQDKQSLSAVQERVSMLQKLLQEEPALKQRLAQAQMDIAQVQKKLRETVLPPLPKGVVFSEELLDEANQLRDSLRDSVSRVKTQIEDSITRMVELKQFIEENKGLGEQVDEQKRKVRLLEKDLAVVKYSVKGLEQTSESLRNRVKPQVERYMGLILPVITSGRYKAVQLEEDYTVRVFDPEAGEFRPKEVFSGGTEDQLLLAMRLAFALALIPQAKGRNPEFLFLDEPLGSSDKVRREGILALMHKELSENFKQIFLISHVGDLEVEADTVIEMDNGTVREIVSRKPSPRQPVEIPA